MFFKILAIFMLLPTIAFGRAVDHCNAFDSQNSGPCLKDQEVISFEEIKTTTNYGIQRASKEPVVASRNCFIDANGNSKCPPVFARNGGCNGDACGPVFKRNEGCDSLFCRLANKDKKEGQEVSCKGNCGPIFNRNEGCDKPSCQKKEPRDSECLTICPEDIAYEDVHKTCDNFGSVHFQHVDFKLKKENKFSNYVNKLGDYRFRIFGCRRNNKEMFLNTGRTMQKDMNFFDIYKKVYGDCIPQVKMPDDLCDPNASTPLPDYVLTAEIVDYAMNVCDEFNWKTTQNKNARSGSSEMTVVWRLMDPTKQKVLWKNSSTGYATLANGESNGEVLLVDRSFEDALQQLRYLDGFQEQISMKPTPQEVQETRIILADLERFIYPAKCDFSENGIVSVSSTCPPCPACTACQKCTTCQEGGFSACQGCDASQPCSAHQGCTACKNKSSCGVKDSCQSCNTCTTTVATVEPQIPLENSGLISDASEINEASGIDSYGNIDTVRVIENEWVDLNTGEITEVSMIQSDGSFCIENELTYKDMNPYNVYKTRASIVDIVSVSGNKKGVGLIINDQFILTSADMISKEENTFNVKTINGVEFLANGFRFSPKKNVALLLTQEEMTYTPLPLELKLPPVGAKGFMTLGMDLQEQSGGEGYVDDETSIAGYRFSEEKGAEIITNQHSQSQTVGGALVDNKGNIYGIAHYGKNIKDEPDMYMPIEAALKSLSVEICGREFLNQKPWKKTDIETKIYKAPQQILETEVK